MVFKKKKNIQTENQKMERRHRPMRELALLPVSSWSGSSLQWVCLWKERRSWGRRNLVIISCQGFTSRHRDLGANCPEEFCPNRHLEAPELSSHTSANILPLAAVRATRRLRPIPQWSRFSEPGQNSQRRQPEDWRSSGLWSNDGTPQSQCKAD